MPDPRNKATGDYLARESLTFERAFRRSKWDRESNDEPRVRRVPSSQDTGHDCEGLWLYGECRHSQGSVNFDERRAA